MEFTYQLMSKKRKDEWRPVYLLHGPEDYLQGEFITNLRELYIEQDFEDFNFISVDYTANIKDLIDTAESTPFMSDKQIIVIRGADKLTKNAMSRFKNYLQRPSQYTSIIFQTSSEFSKRKSFILSQDLDQAIKKFGDVILFRAMKKEEAFNFVSERCKLLEVNIEEKAIERLIQFTGVDLWKLTSALDKVAMFCLGRTITSREIKRILIDDAPVTVFELTEAIVERKQAKALTLLSKLLISSGPLPILGTIIRQWRFIRQAKLLEEAKLFSGRYDSVEKDKAALPQEMIDQLGNESILNQHKYVIFKNIQYAKKFTNEEVMNAICLFYETDRQLKGIGSAQGNDYQIMFSLVHKLSEKGVD